LVAVASSGFAEAVGKAAATAESVQRIGLDAGLVDNKTCAIDEVWSGARFVYRVADRPRPGSGARRRKGA
jgi:hypothetical protein